MKRPRTPRTPEAAALLARQASSEAAAEAGRQSADLRYAFTGQAIAPHLAALGNTAQLRPFLAAVDPTASLPAGERTARAKRLRRAFLRAHRQGWTALPAEGWCADQARKHGQVAPHA